MRAYQGPEVYVKRLLGVLYLALRAFSSFIRTARRPWHEVAPR